ncbi:hypothetical protein [Candidatus Formimonas warabiya]|uniref:PH domain-containing protein n=1 Tax=Formimonas warabiya TaxID=1761012 RepID=A0A3G1KMI9_FORW1|nr:hypothetical protein [Candidatus Formimonas warabiya]ATW23696.1 hypothetical protein DCMF_01825 [Candidatus Formimonas warabiya]
MTNYRKNNLLPLVLSILFFIGTIINFLIRSYTMAGILLILGILWFVGYMINQRPYLTLGEGKLIVSRGIMQPREYDLSKITVAKTEKGYMQLIYGPKSAEEKLNIVLSAMGSKVGQQFLEDFNRSLKDAKDKRSAH